VAGARAVPRAPSGPACPAPPRRVRTTGRWVVSRAVLAPLAGPFGRGELPSVMGSGPAGGGPKTSIYEPGGSQIHDSFSDPHPSGPPRPTVPRRWAGGLTDLGGPGGWNGAGARWERWPGWLNGGLGDGSGGPGGSAAGRGASADGRGGPGGDGGWGCCCGAGWLPLWGASGVGLSGVPVAEDWRCGGVCDCGRMVQAGNAGDTPEAKSREGNRATSQREAGPQRSVTLGPPFPSRPHRPSPRPTVEAPFAREGPEGWGPKSCRVFVSRQLVNRRFRTPTPQDPTRNGRTRTPARRARQGREELRDKPQRTARSGHNRKAHPERKRGAGNCATSHKPGEGPETAGGG